jgi:HK97 family phage portal protein
VRLPRFRREQVTEAKPVPAPGVPRKTPERAGWLNDIPQGGLNEHQAGLGAATQTDRKSLLRELYEAYLACPWAWACVTAISRTITAGGLVTDWDGDDSEGDKPAPDKPPEVLALEALLAYCNPVNDIRQLLRNVVADLQVFADAYIEVAWWGNTPVALYNLDCPTTTPIADAHGTITGYVQVTDQGLKASFQPREVIHISLDSARPGVFGVSPTQAAQLSITSWIFAAACGKEMFKKGLPPNIHVDLPNSMGEPEVRKWRDRFLSGILGIKNLGTPLTTKGGGKVTELTTGKMADVIAGKNQSRDEIVASYGVPPAKAGIIESGNLGGGTGEAQDRTYRIDTCGPIAQLILEKLQFHIAVEGFGVKGWHLKFPALDYQDSEIIERIRDTRLRNGSWTLNKYRAEIGEPPVEGGDDAVLVDRQNLVLWADMRSMSKAMIANRDAPAVAAGESPPGGAPPAQAGQPGGGETQAESLRIVQIGAYRRRLREALEQMPVTEAADPADGVYAQLRGDFPKSAIAWVRKAEWTGPVTVKLSAIDTSDRDEWDATRDPAKVDKLRRKIRKAGKSKPLILIRWPGAAKWVIADGHHRFLAAEAEDLDSVTAYCGRVPREHGDWEVMAASELGRDKAGSGKAA